MTSEQTAAVFTRIRKDIETNPVVLFMKGTPMFPLCGSSAAMAQALDLLGVTYKSVNVLDDPEVRESLNAFSNWPDLPQLFLHGKFVGGGTALREMANSDQLAAKLRESGVAMRSSHA